MNKFQFLGRLTKEVEARNTTGGTSVATMSIAVNRKFADKTTGERQADFFNITAFGKLAETCINYLEKGQQVLFEGRIQNRTWEDDKGNKRYATDFILTDMYFAGSKKSNENDIADVVAEDGEFVTIEDTAELPF